MLEWAVSLRHRKVPVHAVDQKEAVHEFCTWKVELLKRTEQNVIGENRRILAAQRHIRKIEIIRVVLGPDDEHGHRRRNEP